MNDKILDIIKSGYAGVLQNGNIVDRREHPEATPVQANTLLGVPGPKEVGQRCLSDKRLAELRWEAANAKGDSDTWVDRLGTGLYEALDEITSLRTALQHYANPENWTLDDENHAVVWDGFEIDDEIVKVSGLTIAARALAAAKGGRE